MRKIVALLSATAFLAPALSAAPVPVFETTRISQDVRMLADDSFEGRAPATDGETRTIAYITRQMKAAGLQPGGSGGAWTQDVPLL